MYDYNDRNQVTQFPASVLYLLLASDYHFRHKDLDKLVYVPPREPDHDWRFRAPTRPPALILPRSIGRKAQILRILGSHQLDPRWSVADPTFAFGLPLADERGMKQTILRLLDDPAKSKIIEPKEPVGLHDPLLDWGTRTTREGERMYEDDPIALD